MRVETVKIKADNEQGFIIINESDFNKDDHKLFEAVKSVKSIKKDKK